MGPSLLGSALGKSQKAFCAEAHKERPVLAQLEPRARLLPYEPVSYLGTVGGTCQACRGGDAEELCQVCIGKGKNGTCNWMSRLCQLGFEWEKERGAQKLLAEYI